MPKKPSGDFNPVKYRNDWNKENMFRVSAAYSSEFVKEFKQACKDLGTTQSSVIREAMQQTIDQSKKTSF